ncbi:MAG TPA: Lrp/AsnC ligand binding domain-containing protein [Nitrososphaeraceae archaeon]|nr:Lrp/AsnC ligand binding domain-containing protein [Nitrososphaeraceae archaeon]
MSCSYQERISTDKMPTAYILINYEIGTEDRILNRLKNLPGIVEVSELNGIYDIIVKISSDNLDNIKETIIKHIRTIETIRSTMTLIVTEGSKN